MSKSEPHPVKTKVKRTPRRAEPAHGFEGSEERDAQSGQVIGEHSREIERKIGEQMPDRK